MSVWCADMKLSRKLHPKFHALPALLTLLPVDMTKNEAYKAIINLAQIELKPLEGWWKLCVETETDWANLSMAIY